MNQEQDEAWKRIQCAAKKFGIALYEHDWREPFTCNKRPNPARNVKHQGRKMPPSGG